METFIRKYWLPWTIQWLSMMALWFAFVSKMELAEGLVGVFAAAAAATGDTVIRRRPGFVKFKPKASWLLELWREPGYVLTGTALIFRILLRRLIAGKEPDSVLRSVPFDAGGASGRSAARRALALTLTTIPPNFIVIGIDKNEDSMLVHQVEESDVPEVTKRLGAK